MKILISFVLAVVLIGASYYAQGKSTLFQWLFLGGGGLFLAYLFINRPKAASDEQKRKIVQKIINEQL